MLYFLRAAEIYFNFIMTTDKCKKIVQFCISKWMSETYILLSFGGQPCITSKRLYSILINISQKVIAMHCELKYPWIDRPLAIFIRSTLIQNRIKMFKNSKAWKVYFSIAMLVFLSFRTYSITIHCIFASISMLSWSFKPLNIG